MPRSFAVAEVVRSGLVESTHRADVAVTDAAGRLLAWAGDPARIVYGRSCTKPLQAAVSLEAIGDLPLDERQVAIMCASHNGEAVHLRAVRSVLGRAGLDETALLTPPGWPVDRAARARARVRSSLRHNCSGKHAGMLLACTQAGWDPATYPSPRHPLQRRVLAAVRAATGVDDVVVGVDGCGVPVHAVRLREMATMYARLVRPERLGGLESMTRRAIGAMTAAPYLVGGHHRLDTDVMRVSGGAIVVKEGAEALVCAVDEARGIGVAISVADGGDRATGPLLIEALVELDALTPGQARSLAGHRWPAVKGGGAPVGRIAARVALAGPFVRAHRS